jgi:hypothetical protein
MHSFPILTKSEGSLQQFMDFWSRLYDSGQLFHEEYYDQHISNNPLSEEDLTKLFLWKNGMKLSELKEKSLKQKILPKLALIRQYRQDAPPFSVIKETFRGVSAIWLIFVAHIISPKHYPVFDQHVYRAYVYLHTGSIRELENTDSVKLKIYEEEYLPFFREHLNRLTSDKKLDEAMWAFGRFISQNKILYRA